MTAGRPGRLFAVAGAVLGFLVVALHGIDEGKFFALQPADRRCPLRPLGSPAMDERLIPLTARCNWLDGTATDLVPGWVNPALAVLALSVVVLVALGVRAALIRSRAADAVSYPEAGHEP